MHRSGTSPRVVLYLTGAPASGKSSTAAILGELFSARVLSYGALLAASPAIGATHPELRRQSSALVRVEDVRNLDDEMAHLVAGVDGHCVIDSHAVTLEPWGYRVVPFGPEDLQRIGVTAIACLYAEPADLVSRSERDRTGRPSASTAIMERHQDLQMSLALAYSHTAHLPVYFIRSDESPEVVARRVAHACGLGEG